MIVCAGMKGNLIRSKESSINKMGHALHELDPVFRKFTLENDDLKSLARQLDFHKVCVAFVPSFTHFTRTRTT